MNLPKTPMAGIAALLLVTALLGPVAPAQTLRGASPKVGPGWDTPVPAGADVLRSLMDDLLVGRGWGPQSRPAPTTSSATASATSPPPPAPTASANASAPPPERPPPRPSGSTEYLSPAMMGIGYTLAVRPKSVSVVLRHLTRAGEQAFVIGRVRRGTHKAVTLLATGALRTEPGWFNSGYIFPDGYAALTSFR